MALVVRLGYSQRVPWTQPLAALVNITQYALSERATSSNVCDFNDYI